MSRLGPRYQDGGANNGLVNQAKQKEKPLSWLHTSQKLQPFAHRRIVIRDGRSPQIVSWKGRIQCKIGICDQLQL